MPIPDNYGNQLLSSYYCFTEIKCLNAIMTVTDRLTMVHIIPIQTDAAANDIAKLFVRQVIHRHGIPQNIMSDSDTTFTSNFWKAIIQLLNIDLKISSADHTEIYGQSERKNRTVIEMLCMYINEHNNDCIDCNYGFYPNFGTIFNKSSSTSSVPGVQEILTQSINALNRQDVTWKKPSAHQKQNAYKLRRSHYSKLVTTSI